MTKQHAGPFDAAQERPSHAVHDAEEVTIAIYSDPGRTSMWTRRLLREDSDVWSRGAQLVHHQRLIPLRKDRTLDLQSVQRWAREVEADVTIIITEIPRMAGKQPKLAELHFTDGLAIISFPALGPISLRRALGRELRRCVNALTSKSVDAEHDKGGLTTYVEDQQGQSTYYTTPKRPFPGRVWTTLGMMAANEPISALPKLSGVFAAAAATAAFGVFYSTIWELATVLPLWRLALVSLVAVAVVVGWLIIFNRLWDRSNPGSGKREALMYNASTIVSLTVSVAAIYAGLFVAILLMGLLLIEPSFMTTTIGEEASFINYVYIAWLAASLGTTAGAIGSNFDSQADLKDLTQGSRELQRYPRDEEQA